MDNKEKILFHLDEILNRASIHPFNEVRLSDDDMWSLARIVTEDYMLVKSDNE